MPEPATVATATTSQTLVMWAVAAILLLWQVALTVILLRSREEEHDDVANIGRMAYAFSEMLDRLEQIQASIHPHVPHGAYASPEAYAPPPQVAPPPPAQPPPACSCPVHAPAEPPIRHPACPEPAPQARVNYGWQRPVASYGRPVALDDPPYRRR